MRHIEVALGLLAVLILILLNAFFVAGEFALVAVHRGTIERLAEEGNRRAISTLRALRSLSFQLSGAQLGITITSLIVGFLAEPTIGRAIRPAIEAAGLPERSALPVSIVLALGLATATQMVVAELFPKNLAIAKPVELGLRVSGPLRLYNAIFKPFILFLNAAANGTVRLLGVEPQEELIGVRSLDELQLLIYSSREQGTLREEEFSLLARSISFKSKTAADVLVPRVDVLALKEDASLTDMSSLALNCGHSRFPVYGEDLDDIIGIAHVMDIYGYPFERRSRTSVGEIQRHALVAPETASLESLLQKMRGARQQMAVIVDEYGGTAGIVTIEDLLEEIVGEIADEYDIEGQVLATPEAGVHIVSGMLHSDEVGEATGFEFPEGDYETLAGFLLSLFDRVPEQGDHISHLGWEFKVVEMDKNRIARVLVVAPSSDETKTDEAS